MPEKEKHYYKCTKKNENKVLGVKLTYEYYWNNKTLDEISKEYSHSREWVRQRIEITVNNLKELMKINSITREDI